jgi:hypothetical protein
MRPAVSAAGTGTAGAGITGSPGDPGASNTKDMS